MCTYGFGYANAIGPLRMGYIIIGIHIIIAVTYVGLGFDFIPSSEWCPKLGHYEWDTILSDWAT